MATFPNFYENLTEALARLKNTVVLYEGEPYYVWTITDHKGDGKFRVYMTPVEHLENTTLNALNHLPHGHSGLGQLIDEEMAASPEKKILRKMMNSPGFNRFRPFPLGMMNSGENAIYIERVPSRPKMEQGLQTNMLSGTLLSASPSNLSRHVVMSLYTERFKDCVKGRHPTPNEVLIKLTSKEFKNESVAFHREFALVLGPIETLFLAYKQDVVGALPHGDYTSVKLGRKFHHLKEVVEELRLFYRIEKA